MPPNIRLIDSKWVLKKKGGCQLRARLVAQGYTQFIEVDSTKKYSPVITDITLQVILLMRLTKKWDSHTIDIEIEFYRQY